MHVCQDMTITCCFDALCLWRVSTGFVACVVLCPRCCSDSGVRRGWSRQKAKKHSLRRPHHLNVWNRLPVLSNGYCYNANRGNGKKLLFG